MVQVTISGGSELEGSEADIVEGFVVDTEGLVGVLNELMDGKSGVVRLDNGVGDLGRGDNGESGHHTVGELLTNLGDEERTHTGTGTTTERVGDLETLEAVTALGLMTDDIEDLVDKLGTLSVVTLGPVVSSTGLAEDEVVWPEKTSQWTRSDRVHGTGLEVDENSTGNVLVRAYLIVVDVDAGELVIAGANVVTVVVDSVLVREHLPELGTDLVTTLTSLKVDCWELTCQSAAR